MVLTKGCYFLCWSEINHGRHGSHLEKHILNFSSSSGAIELKMSRNVKERELTKCYFSGQSEIQYGRHDSHLEKHILNFSSSLSAIELKMGKNV